MKEENIQVPLWVANKLENTLSLIYQDYDCELKVTCLDRDVHGCLLMMRKLLKHQPLTGMERLEPMID